MFHVNSLNYVVYRLQAQGMSVNSKRQTTPLPALDTTALQLSIVDAGWSRDHLGTVLSSGTPITN